MTIDDLPLEYSDDHQRGARPHLAQMISRVRSTLSGSTTPCGRCGQRASHLLSARNTPFAACGDCARLWSRLTPQQRLDGRGEFTRRGFR